MKKNLPAEHWDLILRLPADGKRYIIEGIAHAAHFPRTAMQCEQVIAETQYGTLRRLKSYDGWRQVEHIAPNALSERLASFQRAKAAQ